MKRRYSSLSQVSPKLENIIERTEKLILEIPEISSLSKRLKRFVCLYRGAEFVGYWEKYLASVTNRFYIKWRNNIQFIKPKTFFVERGSYNTKHPLQLPFNFLLPDLRNIIESYILTPVATYVIRINGCDVWKEPFRIYDFPTSIQPNEWFPLQHAACTPYEIIYTLNTSDYVFINFQLAINVMHVESHENEVLTNDIMVSPEWNGLFANSMWGQNLQSFYPVISAQNPQSSPHIFDELQSNAIPRGGRYP
jgi:hypothetical protein